MAAMGCSPYGLILDSALRNFVGWRSVISCDYWRRISVRFFQCPYWTPILQFSWRILLESERPPPGWGIHPIVVPFIEAYFDLVTQVIATS
jgi:hypothetical protein